MRFKIPSYVFVGGLTALAALPSVRPVFPSLSLDTTLGTYIYLGALVVLVVGYALAEWNQKKESEREVKERHDELVRGQADNTALLRSMVGLNPQTSARIKAETRAEELQSDLDNLKQSYQQKDEVIKAFLRSMPGARGARLDTTVTPEPAVSKWGNPDPSVVVGVPATVSGGGNVTVSPGTGELKVEGYEPTISTQALDEEIREKEEKVIRHFRMKLEPGSFRMTGFPLRDDEGKELHDPDWIPLRPSASDSEEPTSEESTS